MQQLARKPVTIRFVKFTHERMESDKMSYAVMNVLSLSLFYFISFLDKYDEDVFQFLFPPFLLMRP